MKYYIKPIYFPKDSGGNVTGYEVLRLDQYLYYEAYFSNVIKAQEYVDWKNKNEPDDADVHQNSLGLMYRKGRGVTQDNKTATKWYSLAAKQEKKYYEILSLSS